MELRWAGQCKRGFYRLYLKMNDKINKLKCYEEFERRRRRRRSLLLMVVVVVLLLLRLLLSQFCNETNGLFKISDKG
ncbi:hypothetical protein T12_1492 [Trichinella patagoniensis]|uniref:Uncharacterized protein n=1 Tax=Trichinella patagoniensis TaxID=990121 RepID=A0A0V0ZBQ8_9BILA|nr:hypothetical protein T12_1492 [Trichinella patagoniensis]